MLSSKGICLSKIRYFYGSYEFKFCGNEVQTKYFDSFDIHQVGVGGILNSIVHCSQSIFHPKRLHHFMSL